MGITYHKMFVEIEDEAVEAVRKIIKAGLFREKEDIKIKLLTELHTKLCQIYNLEVIKIKFITNHFGTGSYNRNERLIILNKPSLVTYLHEFYHYKADTTSPQENNEENARGWSISLYYLATPKLCKKAILSGKIIHQHEIEYEKEVIKNDR